MEFDVRFDADLGAIVATISDEMKDPRDFAFLAREIVAAAEASGCYRVLTDLRGVPSRLSIVDVYDISHMAAEEGLNWRFKRAIVIGDPDLILEFYAVTSRNRGHNLRAFSSLEEAVTWLGDRRQTA